MNEESLVEAGYRWKVGEKQQKKRLIRRFNLHLQLAEIDTPIMKINNNPRPRIRTRGDGLYIHFCICLSVGLSMRLLCMFPL